MSAIGRTLIRAPRVAGIALAASLCLAIPALASAATAEQPVGPGEPETVTLRSGAEAVAGELVVQLRDQPSEELVQLAPGTSIEQGLRELRSDPAVRWATPNAIARASWIPRDPGRSGSTPGDWQQDQWNFLAPPAAGIRCTAAAPCGINAPDAWRTLRQLNRPEGLRPNGKRGPIVAVVDTGVAYRDRGKRFRRSPELASSTFVAGRDYVDGDGRPLDHNGHGTHVSSTIVQRTGNRKSVTGIGDGLRLMPVRVLNGSGSGTADNVAKGIRFATRNGASVINLSLDFGTGFDSCAGLRGVCKAIRDARKAGLVVVAASGNGGGDSAQMPAKVAFGVASGTIRGCLSDFSSRGKGIDLTAPGGGFDSRDAGSQCRPFAAGPGIVQLTLSEASVQRGDFTNFGYPLYEGTSMAAPHVSAAAALVIASKVLKERVGGRPKPSEVEAWLQCTARAPHDPLTANLYGAGLLDLAAALDKRSECDKL